MVAKLTVIFFIILCLMVGVFLTLLPWTNLGGLVEWSDNYFLNFLVQSTGLVVIKQIVASGWFRGAVTGLGVLNLMLAFWELANFDKNVKSIENSDRNIDEKTFKTN